LFEAPAPSKGSHALQDFSQIPNPYVIEPPTPGACALQAGDNLVFHIVLIGHARDQLALVIFAMQRALASGLTRLRVPADLQQVDVVDATGQALPIWTVQAPLLKEHNNAIQTIAPYALSTGARSQFSLHIHTPMRIQRQSHPLGVAELTPRALLANLARRTALLMEFHAGQVGWGAEVPNIIRLGDAVADTRGLRWYDWTRYSSRQQQEMTLGGVIGTWSVWGSDDTLGQLHPWLWLGQWLHIGKNATMGMGGYTLDRNNLHQTP
jgi:hypothetical protein